MSYNLKNTMLTEEEMFLLRSAIKTFENLCDDKEMLVLESLSSKLNNAECLNKTVR